MKLNYYKPSVYIVIYLSLSVYIYITHTHIELYTNAYLTEYVYNFHLN